MGLGAHSLGACSLGAYLIRTDLMRSVLGKIVSSCAALGVLFLSDNPIKNPDYLSKIEQCMERSK